MEEKKENICRLCLKCEGDTFSQLDETAKEKLKVIVPELNLDAATDFVICSKCNESLEESCELKKVCSDTDQFIRTQIEKENLTDKVNLNRIVNTTSEANGDANSESPNTENICRICLKNKEVNYMSINTAKTDSLFTTALETCLWELDAELTADPVICEICHNTLRNMYSFKTGCLAVEEKLKRYCETTSTSDIDLTKVLDFLKTESKKSLGEDNFLSEFEVQDEEEADIFDIFPNFSGEGATSENNGTNKKRPLAEGSPDAAAKKAKKAAAEDVLPYFNFNFNLIFNPKTEGTMEEWLEKVDELKTKFGWTDYITIHKVLVKLKGMDDLYTWFSSISDIMTWDEWKKKLIQMFPLQNDFYIKLKRMFNRKKKLAETYVDYYNAKLKLIEDLNLSKEKAVSCLIGGVTDIAVGCIARVGNYKTPEELLEYFKSCNDKKPSAVNTPTKNDKAKDKEADANKNSTQTSQTSPEKKVDKKKRMKCFVCRKYGHTSKDCWESSKSVSNGTPNKANTPTAGQRLKPRPRRRCIHCGKIGHASPVCPTKKSTGGSSAPKPQTQAAKAARLALPRSRFVGSVERRPAGPQPTQKKKSNAPSSRCHNCGNYGHFQHNCRKAKQASSLGGYSNRGGAGGRMQDDRYFSRDMMLDRLQEDNSRIVCFKCFRVGHDARDCMDYSGGRAFRN